MNRIDRVNELKAVAQSIIDMAEDLIGDNSYATGYEIIINMFPHNVPEIVLKKSIFPKRLIE